MLRRVWLLVAIAITVQSLKVAVDKIPRSVQIGDKLPLEVAITYFDESDLPRSGICKPQAVDLIHDDDLIRRRKHERRLRIAGRSFVVHTSTQLNVPQTVGYVFALQVNAVSEMTVNRVYRVRVVLEGPDGFPTDFIFSPFTAFADGGESFTTSTSKPRPTSPTFSESDPTITLKLLKYCRTTSLDTSQSRMSSRLRMTTSTIDEPSLPTSTVTNSSPSFPITSQLTGTHTTTELFNNSAVNMPGETSASSTGIPVSDESSRKAGIIAGSVMGSIVLAVLLPLGICYYRRFTKQRELLQTRPYRFLSDVPVPESGAKISNAESQQRDILDAPGTGESPNRKLERRSVVVVDGDSTVPPYESRLSPGNVDIDVVDLPPEYF
ncbi:hypothetical protein VNI00_008134 [Paramarasmius palmivorus]|uniref:Uncharacterized protein n=1 Tax=Paramarasmius palmivorus TaxID=297713 RepID=A0AAW0CZ61_9AGAR